MDNAISISNLNDFIFCPASIYFHNLYGSMDKMILQGTSQINGSNAHEKIDSGLYISKRDVLQGISVYSEKYNLIGKIDVFDQEKGILTESKKKIKVIYDGYVFQLYAQYFALIEMGYMVNNIRLYSKDDNKVYNIDLPKDNPELLSKFERLIDEMKNFDLENFQQKNKAKCCNCIYEPACDRSLI